MFSWYKIALGLRLKELGSGGINAGSSQNGWVAEVPGRCGVAMYFSRAGNASAILERLRVLRVNTIIWLC